MDRSDSPATLAHVLRRRYVALAPEDSARDAEAFMRMGRFRALPVVSDDRLEGMLCYALLVGTLLAGEVDAPGSLERALRETSVAELMDRKPAQLGADASAAEAAFQIAQTGIGCVPVVDGERRLLGIVTEGDLIRRRLAEPA
jgi:CBS domain-containing membrane protein